MFVMNSPGPETVLEHLGADKPKSTTVQHTFLASLTLEQIHVYAYE